MNKVIRDRSFKEWMDVFKSMEASYTVLASHISLGWRVIKPVDENVILLQTCGKGKQTEWRTVEVLTAHTLLFDSPVKV